MMGELKYFLGFEIKQMCQGTFINQSKYIQDMLKRFDMKGANGIGTPMHLKCQLTLDETGKAVDPKLYRSMIGSSKPHGGAKVKLLVPRCHREQEEEEIISPRTTKRQRAVAANKRTTSGPQRPMSGLTKKQFLEIQQVNPYLVDKNHRLCPNTYFYHPNQERIYKEIYGAKEFNCCPQCSISMDKLRSKPEYFPRRQESSLPRYGKNAPKDKEEEEADSDDSDFVPNSVKTKGLFAKLTARLKKSFCFKEDLQDRMYQAHHDNKKIRQRQKAMMRHMQLPVSEGSEDNITPPDHGAPSINFNQFLEKEKLKGNGSNFTDWFRHVRIFLTGVSMQYVLEAPLGPPPPPAVSEDIKNVYETRVTRYSEVQCAILCSLEAELQKRFEHHDPCDMMRELKLIFETHAAVESYEASKQFFNCMMEEGSSVSEHMFAMSGHAKKLSDLGIVIPNQLGIHRVLQSLPPSYKNFVMNYNMQNMNKELPELFSMLKSAEVEIKKENQVLMVNKTTSFKKQGKPNKGNFKKGGKKVAAPPKKPKDGPKPETMCYYCQGRGTGSELLQILGRSEERHEEERNPPGNSLPEGEIDAIAIVIELDIISIIITIISIIYTAISTAASRHRCHHDFSVWSEDDKSSTDGESDLRFLADGETEEESDDDRFSWDDFTSFEEEEEEEDEEDDTSSDEPPAKRLPRRNLATSSDDDADEEDEDNESPVGGRGSSDDEPAGIAPTAATTATTRAATAHS
ncbi:hypothetical protein QYE76_011710 [Lolium multiflorum]|uniref:Uncharacterized protein n=1 Tax=Lolium multiflorum TaxID=4521 RepID=A0AAD8X300_LOLMU|nr:hypothetical protein QYE76_011710 [Lolium multiflorum]